MIIEPILAYLQHHCIPEIARNVARKTSSIDREEIYKISMLAVLRLLAEAYATSRGIPKSTLVGSSLFKNKPNNFTPELLGHIVYFTELDCKDIKPHELGEIHENLLEWELDEELKVNDLGADRRSTGSFYTPDFLVEYILDQTLEPKLDEHHKEDKFRVADISMGTGNFILAAARRLKARGMGIDSILGIDIIPTAVEIARVSLFVEFYQHGMKLSDVEKYLLCGDSLGHGGLFRGPLEKEILSRPIDVVIGNPPWNMPVVDDLFFWSRHSKGYLSMPAEKRVLEQQRLQKERPDLVEKLNKLKLEASRLRSRLTTLPYPEMGLGTPDLFKAFLWRNLEVCADGGIIGLVVPQGVLVNVGCGRFRWEIMNNSFVVSIFTLYNKNGWIFPGVSGTNSILLIFIHKALGKRASIILKGPAFNRQNFNKLSAAKGAFVDEDEVSSWSENRIIPSIGSAKSLEILREMNRFPKLPEEAGGAYYQRHEEEGSVVKGLDPSTESPGEGYAPVYKYASFNLWNPDTKNYLGWKKVDKSTLLKSDNFCTRPKIMYRERVRKGAKRVCVVTLAPPNAISSQITPQIKIKPETTAEIEAFTLGMLCSMPIDWYVRHFVDRHLKTIVDSIPMPRFVRLPEGERYRTYDGWYPYLRMVNLAGYNAAYREHKLDERFWGWAHELGLHDMEGHPAQTFEEDCAEMDAISAHIFGLSVDQVKHMFNEVAEFRKDSEDYVDDVLENLAEFNKSKCPDGGMWFCRSKSQHEQSAIGVGHEVLGRTL